jgi:hypothetical protein
MAVPETNLEELQAEWKELFQKTLPAAATSKSPAQVGHRSSDSKGLIS